MFTGDISFNIIMLFKNITLSLPHGFFGLKPFPLIPLEILELYGLYLLSKFLVFETSLPFGISNNPLWGG